VRKGRVRGADRIELLGTTPSDRVLDIDLRIDHATLILPPLSWRWMSIKPSLLIVYWAASLRLAQAREFGLLTLGQGLPLCRGSCPAS